jgi:hypothetical protein
MSKRDLGLSAIRGGGGSVKSILDYEEHELSERGLED